MSKTSFRSRAIDPERPIPICHIDQLTDLADYAAVSRSIIQMPTGMEKDEETEQHLQIAMEAQATYGETGQLVIPIPEVLITQPPVYPPERKFTPTVTYFKQGINFEEAVGQKYDADSEDEIWLKQNVQNCDLYIEKSDFENCIDKLEWLRKIQPNELKLNTIETFVNMPSRVTMAIFEYWKNKRKTLKSYNHSLCPDVRTEQDEGVNFHDPYVAFRKRFEKMQTRKNRKFEEQLFERLIKTHINITRTESLFKLIETREETKLQYQLTLLKLFTLRHQSNDVHNGMLNKALQLSSANGVSTSIESLFIGTGVMDIICNSHSFARWRPSSVQFSSNCNVISRYFKTTRMSNNCINQVALSQSDNGIRSVGKNNKLPIQVHRNEAGQLFRYRINRSGQKVIDYLSSLQSNRISIFASNSTASTTPTSKQTNNDPHPLPSPPKQTPQNHFNDPLPEHKCYEQFDSIINSAFVVSKTNPHPQINGGGHLNASFTTPKLTQSFNDDAFS